MKTTKGRKNEILDYNFRRAFHSPERIEFFRNLPCEVTSRSRRESSEWARVVNAHTKGGGVGRRGPYTSIVPLKWDVHGDFDCLSEAQWETKYGRTKQSVRDRAPHYAALWDNRNET